MGKYVMMYKGEATAMEDMTPEQGQELMAKWGAWMEKVGSGLSDIGAPFGPSASIVDGGSSGSVNSLTGYSIVEADSLAAAQALTEGHPYLSDSGGNYAIDIYELMPVPFEQ